MKKNLFKIITSISVIIFLFFTIIRCQLHIFDSRDVKENIAYLSSSTFEGRLPGSNGNDEASIFIENSFKEGGLEPFNDEYDDYFKIVAPYLNGEKPSLSITDSKGKNQVFNYETDFKEDMLNFKESKATLSFKDKFRISDNAIAFNKNNNIFLFYVDDNKDTFDFRSSFDYDSPVSFAISLTQDSFDKILKGLEAKGTLNITLPFSVKNTYASNIIGVVKGKSNELPPLVLTAHFDHLGKDYSGNIYGGALDNASGTAFLLELSKVIESYPKPNRDIIFVALNGEEFGFLGSSDFCFKYKDRIKGGTVINFDMIGANTESLTLMKSKAYKDIEGTLEKDLTSISVSKNINTDVTYEDSSDHVPFSKDGFDSLTLTNSDTSKIHTPNDTIDYISEDSIDESYSLVWSYVSENCYSNFTKLIYNKYLHMGSFLIALLLVGYLINTKIRESKKHL